MTEPEAQSRLHDAIQGIFDEDELVVHWCLVAEVVGPDNSHYLSHRGGGGIDGQDSPMAWSALGMLQASARVAEEQVLDSTRDVDDDENA